MLYYIPIEPLEERYTKQWYDWFPEEFAKSKIPYEVIDGTPLTDKVITGTFLDINSTVYYKANQLQKIAQMFYEKKIKANDVFFVGDIEFWGIESIRFLSDLNKVPVEIYGFLHAASYTTGDFMEQCSYYSQKFEEGWFRAFDRIFVGTHYHKDKVESLRDVPKDKIIVTGNPYKVKEVKDSIGYYEKENMMILNHRPDYEKRPNITLDVFYILKNMYPNWRFIVTTSREFWGKGWIRDKALNLRRDNVIEIHENLTKKDYLTLLAKSKIMTGNTIEENFGYSVLEACVFNTYPIIENKYSHPELLENDDNLLFDSVDDQILKITNMMNNTYDVEKYAKNYENVFSYVIECMGY